MTRSRYRIHDSEHAYFMTCTIVGWLPVFTRPEAVEIILDSWRFLQRERGFRLYGYVILENHLHLVAAAPELAEAMKSFKMYTARKIIDLLEANNAETLLRQLRAHKSAHKTKSDYQVWQEGSHPKEIGNEEMMGQKLEYMHNNPVKRGYVDEPVHWRYCKCAELRGEAGAD